MHNYARKENKRLGNFVKMRERDLGLDEICELNILNKFWNTDLKNSPEGYFVWKFPGTLYLRGVVPSFFFAKNTRCIMKAIK